MGVLCPVLGSLIYRHIRASQLKGLQMGRGLEHLIQKGKLREITLQRMGYLEILLLSSAA